MKKELFEKRTALFYKKPKIFFKSGKKQFTKLANINII